MWLELVWEFWDKVPSTPCFSFALNCSVKPTCYQAVPVQWLVACISMSEDRPYVWSKGPLKRDIPVSRVFRECHIKAQIFACDKEIGRDALP